MMYANEKAFGKAFMERAKGGGLQAMRIESASTISGCPDLWLQGNGDDWFVELKRVHKKAGNILAVPWRPGQVGWGLKYKANHQRVVGDMLYTKYSWTACMLDDGKLVMVRMSRAYKDNNVRYADADTFLCDWDVFDVAWLLRTYSYALSPVVREGETLRMLLDRTMAAYVDMWRPGAYDLMDVPPVEDWWEYVPLDVAPRLDVRVDMDWLKVNYRWLSRHTCEQADSLLRAWLYNDAGPDGKPSS